VVGASTGTRRVSYVNANWTAGRGDAAAFQLLVVTEDGERHTLPVPADQMAALVALTQVDDVVLLWDPEGHTLVAANLVGTWVPPGWSATSEPAPSDPASSDPAAS
jgi:hypothetical protein